MNKQNSKKHPSSRLTKGIAKAVRKDVRKQDKRAKHKAPRVIIETAMLGSSKPRLTNRKKKKAQAASTRSAAGISDKFTRRREKVTDLFGNLSKFPNTTALYINPGNALLFPIFSQIASTYT